MGLNLAQAAQQFARLGWAVFPVEPGGKRPLTPHGCRDATTDPYAIATWWTRWPNANIGLACGAVSGLDALDLDRKGDVNGFSALAELEAEFASLPLTVTSVTPSGGKHYLFRNPGLKLPNRVGLRRDVNGISKIYRGLDFRADGGYIVLPPSARPDGAYRWLNDPDFIDLAPPPDWLLRILMPPPSRPPMPSRLTWDLKPDAYVLAVINGECRAVAQTKPGERNDRLFRAAARLGEIVGSGLLPRAVAERVLEQAADESGLPADDAGWAGVRATIASGLNRGLQNPWGRQ